MLIMMIMMIMMLMVVVVVAIIIVMIHDDHNGANTKPRGHHQSSRSPASRQIYTSMCSFPQWHGLTQAHFPPRPRKTAWHSDITDVISPLCATDLIQCNAKNGGRRQSSRSPATRRHRVPQTSSQITAPTSCFLWCTCATK